MEGKAPTQAAPNHGHEKGAQVLTQFRPNVPSYSTRFHRLTILQYCSPTSNEPTSDASPRFMLLAIILTLPDWLCIKGSHNPFLDLMN